MSKKPAGIKNDQRKLRLELIPTESLRQQAAAMTVGAIKYGDNNWRGGLSYSRLYGAAMRHLTAFWDGETHCPEDGQPHLGAALACIGMLAAHHQQGLGTDDRPKTDN